MTKGARVATAPTAPWRSRIVGTGEEAPDQLLANPANWRLHPKAQQDALAGALDQVGWVQQVLVNRRSGFVVDGHARVALALSRGEATVPVLYVDLDPDEEALVLATLDPIGAMAGRDDEKLKALLADVTVDDAGLLALLGDLGRADSTARSVWFILSGSRRQENLMPQAERIVDILAGRTAVGARATVQGWIRTRRDSKAGLSFLHVHDGSCFDALQVVAPAALGNYQDEVLHLTAGCAVTVTGTVAASQGQGQAVELLADEVVVVGWVDDPETYPISPKRHTFEYLREVAHLRVRTNTFGAVARVRHCLAMAIHRYFDEHGYYWVHTPIVTASDSEGAGELFRVSTLDLANLPRTPEGAIDYAQDFFGKPAYLTVSGQLNIEAYCVALTRVYTFGPTFRAENSNTSRHLSEFWMVEPEIAFADITANADLAEDLLRYSFRAVLDERADDMAFFAERIDKEAVSRLEAFVTSSFARMEYTEAIEVLQRSGRAFEFPVEWGVALQAEHERYLCEEYAKRPVVVVNYPKQIKAFYMRSNDDERTVAAMDVLAPGIGEIVGGSQREERLDVLDARIRETGLDPAAYWWYRDLRRYGTVPHAGFGLGFDRAVAYATGMANIRDVIPFPRTPGSADF